MIRSQVVSFCLVEMRSQLRWVSLVREAEIRLRHVVVLLFDQSLRSGAPNLKVMRLDGSNEILVGRLDGFVWVTVREEATVSRYESVSVALA